MPKLQPHVNMSKGFKVKVSSTHHCMLLRPLYRSQSLTFDSYRQKRQCSIMVTNGQQAGMYLTWALRQFAVFPNLFTSMIAQVLIALLC